MERVLILARHRTPDQNGLLIHAEARRQGIDADLGDVGWPGHRIIRECESYDWVIITGMRSVPAETVKKIKSKVFIWDADGISPFRRRYWNAYATD